MPFRTTAIRSCSAVTKRRQHSCLMRQPQPHQMICALWQTKSSRLRCNFYYRGETVLIHMRCIDYAAHFVFSQFQRANLPLCHAPFPVWLLKVFGEAGCVVLPSKDLMCDIATHPGSVCLRWPCHSRKPLPPKRADRQSRAGPDAPLLGGSTPSGCPIRQQSTGR